MKITKNILSKLKEKLKCFRQKILEINIKDIIAKLKDTRIILTSIVLCFCLLALVFWSVITSKDELLKDLETSLKEGRASVINGEIHFSGSTLSKAELAPLMKYFKYENSRINKTIDQLRSVGKSDVFTIKKDRKLFWDDFYLELNPISIKVKTNIKNAKIYLNDKELNQGIEKGAIPGIYMVKAIVETPYGKVTKEKEVVLIDNEELELNLDAMNITISSNFDDADVYINKKNIGKKVKDVKNFGPVPMNSDVTISLEKKFPWGVIKSEEVKVGNIPNVNIDIDMVNDTLIDNIKTVSQEFYKSVFEALNARNKELIKLTDQNTQDKIYNEIEKKSWFLKNNYEISELSTEIESSEFRLEDNLYKAKVVIKVGYNSYKKLLPFMKEPYEDMFLTTMKYIGDKWLIEDIQKFKLE